MILDEEQKFGAKLKATLRAKAPHLLAMTATPIPRTLQAAMVGVQDVSVIASPPARRRPIRTFLAPFDAATLRTALLREKRRGGQSFVVAPRIADLEGLRRAARRGRARATGSHRPRGAAARGGGRGDGRLRRR